MGAGYVGKHVPPGDRPKVGREAVAVGWSEIEHAAAMQVCEMLPAPEAGEVLEMLGLFDEHRMPYLGEFGATGEWFRNPKG